MIVMRRSTRVDKDWKIGRLRFGYGFYIRRYPAGTLPDRWELKPFFVMDRKKP